MFVLLGYMVMKEDDYDGAIKLFKLAQPQSPSQASPHLQTISLVSNHFLKSRCILILLESYSDGSLMDLDCRFEDSYARHCMPLVR